MKILQLIWTLTGGGAERQLAYVSQELQRRGHDVCVGHVQPGVGVWPAGVPAQQLPSRTSRDPRLIVDVLRLIRSCNADVVQTWNLAMDVVGGLAATMAGVPWIVREPSSGALYGRGFKPRLRLGVARAGAEAVVANSLAGQQYWATHAPRLPTVVIRNAVPVEAIEASVPFARRAEVPVGVFVGRLEALKNVDVLLRAGAAVMAERDLLLVLCGDGPERERLAALTAQLGIAARVRFTGFVPDVWRYVRGADFAVLLSDVEGGPNAVIESFAAGTPVILSDITAHRELASDDAAVLVPLRDIGATACAIQSVLDDPTAAFNRSRIARGSVADWSIAAAAAAFEELYATVIAGREGSHRNLPWRDRRVAVSRRRGTNGGRCE